MESLLDTSQARNAKDYANGQINSFIENVEDLTHALKDIDTPELARVKAKVKMALAAAKSALADGAEQVRTQARQVSKNTDTYVRDNPWQVVGIAALIGLAVGILTARRSD
jgi:ElaB protein